MLEGQLFPMGQISRPAENSFLLVSIVRSILLLVQALFENATRLLHSSNIACAFCVWPNCIVIALFQLILSAKSFADHSNNESAPHALTLVQTRFTHDDFSHPSICQKYMEETGDFRLLTPAISIGSHRFLPHGVEDPVDITPIVDWHKLNKLRCEMAGKNFVSLSKAIARAQKSGSVDAELFEINAPHAISILHVWDDSQPDRDWWTVAHWNSCTSWDEKPGLGDSTDKLVIHLQTNHIFKLGGWSAYSDMLSMTPIARRKGGKEFGKTRYFGPCIARPVVWQQFPK